MPEVIDKGDGSPSHPTPLLFVHGAFHGAWCWDEHFLDFFADRGYRALALNLRGHGSGPMSTPINSCTLRDYVADVAAAADALPGHPVLIGHSMGGAVVQKYLSLRAAPAGVLVASAPPRGIGRAALRVARRHWRDGLRARAVRRPLRLFGVPSVSRATFYSRHTPDEDVARYTALLVDESTRVLYRDLLYADLPRPRRVTTPMLVLGAELDGFFSVREIHATARAYRTRAQLVAGMSHNMMLEQGWTDVARRIDDWLCAGGL